MRIKARCNNKDLFSFVHVWLRGEKGLLSILIEILLDRGPEGTTRYESSHTDCGEAGSAASRKQGDIVGRSCNMSLEERLSSCHKSFSS